MEIEFDEFEAPVQKIPKDVEAKLKEEIKKWWETTEGKKAMGDAVRRAL